MFHLHRLKYGELLTSGDGITRRDGQRHDGRLHRGRDGNAAFGDNSRGLGGITGCVPVERIVGFQRLGRLCQFGGMGFDELGRDRVCNDFGAVQQRAQPGDVGVQSDNAEIGKGQGRLAQRACKVAGFGMHDQLGQQAVKIG